MHLGFLNNSKAMEYLLKENMLSQIPSIALFDQATYTQPKLIESCYIFQCTDDILGHSHSPKSKLSHAKNEQD